ncbi:MAG: hypothetical protein JNG84_03665 [Archangium sp.]|nr:hypothetical protein [Archangium sp.]
MADLARFATTPVNRTRHELELARRELVAATRSLRDDVRAITDFRRPLRRRPWLFLCSALVVGFGLAALHHHRSTS